MHSGRSIGKQRVGSYHRGAHRDGRGFEKKSDCVSRGVSHGQVLGTPGGTL